MVPVAAGVSLYRPTEDDPAAGAHQVIPILTSPPFAPLDWGSSPTVTDLRGPGRVLHCSSDELACAQRRQRIRFPAASQPHLLSAYTTRHIRCARHTTPLCSRDLGMQRPWPMSPRLRRSRSSCSLKFLQPGRDLTPGAAVRRISSLLQHRCPVSSCISLPEFLSYRNV